ncbi:MAG: hypothetical protein JW806_10610 [Sedimentisphaerales bacterium]|nr:hypothetical protein [Sedimentisphaerales bacterium]
MKNKILYSAILLFVAVMLAGCQEVKRIDTANDDGKQVLALDYRDFDQVASEMVQSMLASGALKKEDGSRYVVAISEIINATTQRFNTDRLMAKIEEDLMNSGQVVITSAVGNKIARDDMVHDIRDVRKSEYEDEFKEGTLAEEKQLIAPGLSISGMIFQKELAYDKDKTQVEYYFQLKITELASGLRFWQKELIIGKRGKNY